MPTLKKHINIGLARVLGADIAISKAFAEAAGLDPHAEGWALTPAQKMEGRSQPIDIFSYRRRGVSVDAEL